MFAAPLFDGRFQKTCATCVKVTRCCVCVSVFVLVCLFFPNKYATVNFFMLLLFQYNTLLPESLLSLNVFFFVGAYDTRLIIHYHTSTCVSISKGYD